MSITIERESAAVWRLEALCEIARPRDEVFPFFADASNLERITPSAVRFRIITPMPIEMRRGAIINYALRIKGIPIRWTTEITEWDPPNRFADTQRKGPYKLWEHVHEFEESDDGASTIMRDVVRYTPRGGALTNRLFVERDVRRIFEHRNATIAELFKE